MARTSPSPSPSPPPSPSPSPSTSTSEWPRWWIYGAAIGAVVVGATVVYLTTTGDDTQKFEVHYP